MFVDKEEDLVDAVTHSPKGGGYPLIPGSDPLSVMGIPSHTTLRVSRLLDSTETPQEDPQTRAIEVPMSQPLTPLHQYPAFNKYRGTRNQA